MHAQLNIKIIRTQGYARNWVRKYKITSRNITTGCLYNLEEDKKSIISLSVYKNSLIIHIF